MNYCIECKKEVHKSSDRCRNCASGKHLAGINLSEEHRDKIRISMENRINPATTPGARAKLTLKALLRHGHKDRTIPAFNALYRTYQDSAYLRNFEFELSKDDFKELTQGDCYYCGEKPKQIRRNGRKTSSSPSFYIYNGIDRVDNNIGYQKFNCVPCCPQCNKMKRALNVDVFINHSRKIVKNWENK